MSILEVKRENLQGNPRQVSLSFRVFALSPSKGERIEE